ncbi:unnamed protein product [Colias eurytheme]|nr:unnamed protein product [Colias eurytheme]
MCHLKEKADTFAILFAQNSRLDPTNTTPPSIPHCCSVMPSIRIRQKDVLNIMRGLDVNKASGPDGIPGIVLRMCAPELSPILTRLFRLSLESGATIDPETKVFGGKDAPEGAFPHQVSLRKTTWREYHSCGGSIVRKSWVLTAAHCTIDAHPDNITVVAGTNSLSSSGLRYDLDEIINHENYNRTTLENDIALLRIDGEFEYSSNIASIALAEQPTPAGTECVLSGWGYIDYYDRVPDKLQMLYLKTVSVEQCREDLSTNGKPSNLPVTDTNVCASREEGVGACQGDSGGPLAVNNTLIGVVSWGRFICGQGVPEVYASVYKFRNWINGKINNSDE